ncbi:MAG: dephospho-CoA kinase [Chloroflexi bacterium]|nr:dephospho-CoA kinase [Chloroflexota bacterium]
MIVIGLTGGILSGKTTVSQMLQEKGAVIIDADKVGHQVYVPGMPAWEEVVATWGSDILQESGEVDRKKLGAIVFSNPEALKKLNEIMYPRIFQAIMDRLVDLRQKGTRVAVVEAAVLLDIPWWEMVNQIWVVVASEEAVLQRVRFRGGFTEEQARARLRSQVSNEERIRYADVVINTDCSLEEVRARVDEPWQRLDADHPGTPKALSLAPSPRKNRR